MTKYIHYIIPATIVLAAVLIPRIPAVRAWREKRRIRSALRGVRATAEVIEETTPGRGVEYLKCIKPEGIARDEAGLAEVERGLAEIRQSLTAKPLAYNFRQD